MLLALMYHRVGTGKHANSEEMLRAHLTHLAKTHPIVLPGDPLPKRQLSVCLTFDDASYDFYHTIYPILQELNIRALLGVPARYILESTTVDSKERLSVPYTMAMQDGFFDQKAPFCTWEELNEMVKSGHVEVASHSYMHCNLTFDFVDLQREVVLSKQIIEERLHQPVSSFIYPFGRANVAVQEFVAEHYPYAFRIGSALNFGWGTGKKALSRVIADHMPTPTSLLSTFNRMKYTTKALVS